MKRVIICLLLVLLLTPAVFAADFVVDDRENVLTGEEHLSRQLTTLSAEYGMDILVVTAPNFGGRSAERYADTCWKESGAADGILFLFSMTEREYYLYTAGKGMDVFDDDALDKIESTVASALRAEAPDGAASAFAEAVQTALEDYAAEQASWVWKTPLICFGIGAVIALIVVLVMASRHKSVKSKHQASDYVCPGSFHLTQSLDLYLYHTTTRRAKPQNSGSGGGSSGRSHGGRGGSF